MAVNIPPEVFGHGIANGLLQLDALRLLGRHIDHNVSRDTVCLIGQPFDGTGVDKGCYTDRLSPVVDLAVDAAHLKLGHVFHHSSHFPVAQKLRRGFVEKRNLVVVYGLDVLGKLTVLHGQKLLVFFCIDNGGGKQASYQQYCHQQNQDSEAQLGKGDAFFLFILQFSGLCEADFSPGKQEDDDCPAADQKHPGSCGVDVEGRDGYIVVDAGRQKQYDDKRQLF